MTAADDFLGRMTDEERSLWDQSVVHTDRITPLVYADWLEERGRTTEADYWRLVAGWRSEMAVAPPKPEDIRGRCDDNIDSMLRAKSFMSGRLSDFGCPCCTAWIRLKRKERPACVQAGLVPYLTGRVI